MLWSKVWAQQNSLPIGTPQLTTSSHCTKEVERCEPLKDGNKTKCFGVVLPYSHTSLALAADSYNQSEAFEKLFQWEGLKNVPKCWEVIQPFLCATYLPKCSTKSNGNDTIHTIALTGKELCERTREPCKIVESVRGWPEFLQCNSSHFPQQCKVSTYQELHKKNAKWSNYRLSYIGNLKQQLTLRKKVVNYGQNMVNFVNLHHMVLICMFSLHLVYFPPAFRMKTTIRTSCGLIRRVAASSLWWQQQIVPAGTVTWKVVGCSVRTPCSAMRTTRKCTLWSQLRQQFASCALCLLWWVEDQQLAPVTWFVTKFISLSPGCPRPSITFQCRIMA